MKKDKKNYGMSMRMPGSVIEWMDKYRGDIPRTKFLSNILSQITVDFDKNGEPAPKIKQVK